jgi:hypothetical protein
LGPNDNGADLCLSDWAQASLIPVDKKTLSGVDVMITIFCDFSQFSAKKLAFFLNTNVMINFFQI